MAMKGWLHAGIVLSVMAFFPLGIFIWSVPNANESRYYMQSDACLMTRRHDVEAMDQTRDNMDLWSKSKARYEQCMSKARLDYESTNPPSATTHLLIVIAIALVLIGFGWLIVWGCIAVGRWVYRGFA